MIPRLAADLHAEFPELKGFSERNLNYMIRFAREYGAPGGQFCSSPLHFCRKAMRLQRCCKLRHNDHP